MEFCCCHDCHPPWAFPVLLYHPTLVTSSLPAHPSCGGNKGAQRLAGPGRHSSSLGSLPPPAAGYSLSPYCFPVLLAPVKAHSDFHKTEQRKILKCQELSRQHTELPPFLAPKNLSFSLSFFFLQTPHPPGSHNSSIKHNQPFPTKQRLRSTTLKLLHTPPW